MRERDRLASGAARARSVPRCVQGSSRPQGAECRFRHLQCQLAKEKGYISPEVARGTQTLKKGIFNESRIQLVSTTGGLIPENS